MMIKGYIARAAMEDALRLLQTLPRQIRPHSFSVNEDRDGTMGKIAAEGKFQTFIAKNEYGFFLFSDQARYNIVLRPKHGFSSIVLDDLGSGLTESDAMIVLNTLATAGSAFAFAALIDEYHHRNRYVREFGGDQFEAWVGRDLRKYLPGLYWLTVFPKEHKELLSELTGALGATLSQMDSGHWRVKAFAHPNEWRQHAARIDEWLAGQPAFFSKRRVIAQLDAAPTTAALSEIAAKYA